MPIYEYRCTKGHTFDAIQRMSEEPLTTCEVCGAAVERVLHAPAVHFKGSGFYNTDYGTRKRAREIKSSGEGKSGEGKSGESSASSNGGDSKSGDSASTTSSEGSGSRQADSAPKSSAA